MSQNERFLAFSGKVYAPSHLLTPEGPPPVPLGSESLLVEQFQLV